jgi:hypothetical protein
MNLFMSAVSANNFHTLWLVRLEATNIYKLPGVPFIYSAMSDLT